MNTTQLVNRFRYRYRDLGGTWVKDALALEHINAARKELLGMVPWLLPHERTAIVSTVAGQRALDLPGGVSSLSSVESIFNIDTNRTIRPMPNLRDVRDAWPQWATESGEPAAYRVEAAGVILAPVPDAVYRLEMFFNAPVSDLGAGEEPPEPEHLHEAYVEGALERAFADNEEQQRAQYHRERFESYVNLAMDTTPMNRESRYPEVIDDFFDDTFV